MDEYLQMRVDAGAHLYACKMSVDMFGLKKEDFVEGVEDIVTAGDFMDMTEGAQIFLSGDCENANHPRIPGAVLWLRGRVTVNKQRVNTSGRLVLESSLLQLVVLKTLQKVFTTSVFD